MKLTPKERKRLVILIVTALRQSALTYITRPIDGKFNSFAFVVNRAIKQAEGK